MNKEQIINDCKKKIKQVDDKVVGFIKNNPKKAVVKAGLLGLALGIIIGKLIKRRSK